MDKRITIDVSDGLRKELIKEFPDIKVHVLYRQLFESIACVVLDACKGKSEREKIDILFSLVNKLNVK